jgi:putative ABC transport system permease protein
MVTVVRTALNRKLLRELWQMRGQALAIAAVVMAGVAMLVMYLSNFSSLQDTLARYYASQRLADVFAVATRAPLSLVPRVAGLPGVDRVDARVIVDVVLLVPGLDDPATARLITRPDPDAPILNGLVLRRGRWPSSDRPDEVLASETFVEAHHMTPGDMVSVIINGRRRQLQIVGVALSPEYVYSIRAGEIVPDDRRFGVFWMHPGALAAATDLTGSFNSLALSLSPGASPDAVIGRVDQLLAPYGGRGAYPQEQQPSVWTVRNELAQLQTFGIATPAIFLAVAAFILHIALSRTLALQRPQIASLKALGYSNAALLWHYLKLALVIAAVGAMAGVVTGAYLGQQVSELYHRYFRFPELFYRVSLDVAAGAVLVSLAVAALGAQSAVRRALSIPPAEAMRPEPPPRFGQGWLERLRLFQRLSPSGRMLLRQMARRPARTALSVLGLAAAGAVLLIGFSFIDIMDVLISQQFDRAWRQDVTLSFTQPLSSDVVSDVAHLPGVMRVEPQRAAAVRLRAGARHRTVAIQGLVADPVLQRVLDRKGRVYQPPGEGLLLSQALARLLDVSAGQNIEADVLEGERRTLIFRVVGLVDDALGLQAYTTATALSRALREQPRVTGVVLQMDAQGLPAFHARLRALPAVAGVASTSAMLRNFRALMAQNLNVVITLNVVFSAIIAIGIAYNSCRVALSERSRDLASLRVLGFTRAEVSLLLVGELLLVTLASLPIGMVLGQALGNGIMQLFNNELYRLSYDVSWRTVAWMALTNLAAMLVSAALVVRQLHRVDLVSVLKERE